jgi:hypothetical protein
MKICPSSIQHKRAISYDIRNKQRNKEGELCKTAELRLERFRKFLPYLHPTTPCFLHCVVFMTLQHRPGFPLAKS